MHILDNEQQESFLKRVAFESIFIGLKSVSAYDSLKNSCVVGKDYLKVGKDIYNLNRRVFLFSFGKVACEMAQFSVNKIEIFDGIIASDKPCNFYAPNIEFFLSSHPFPNKNSVDAANRLIDMTEIITPEDFVIFLISGGASSIIEKPVVDLDFYVDVMKKLLSRNYSIYEINTVRKGLSLIKGGKILRRIKGNVVSFVISDVVGDDLSVIGSSLTYFSSFEKERYRQILLELGIDLDVEYDVLSKAEFENMKVKNYIIASNKKMCEAVCNVLEERGINLLYLGSKIQGNVECVADFISSVVKEMLNNSIKIKRPSVVVFGGETTVSLTNNGIGGRNQHLSLLVAENMKNETGFFFLSFATDGKDGNSKNAGAWVDEEIYEDAKKLHMDMNYYINTFNSSLFFDRVGRAIKGFNTHTNVADVGLFLFK